jgi:hypothetical protein
MVKCEECSNKAVLFYLAGRSENIIEFRSAACDKHVPPTELLELIKKAHHYFDFSVGEEEFVVSEIMTT